MNDCMDESFVLRQLLMTVADDSGSANSGCASASNHDQPVQLVDENSHAPPAVQVMQAGDSDAKAEEAATSLQSLTVACQPMQHGHLELQPGNTGVQRGDSGAPLIGHVLGHASTSIDLVSSSPCYGAGTQPCELTAPQPPEWAGRHGSTGGGTAKDRSPHKMQPAMDTSSAVIEASLAPTSDRSGQSALHSGQLAAPLETLAGDLLAEGLLTLADPAMSKTTLMSNACHTVLQKCSNNCQTCALLCCPGQAKPATQDSALGHNSVDAGLGKSVMTVLGIQG